MITGVSTGMPCQRARLLNYDQICFTVAVIETHLTKQSRRGVAATRGSPPPRRIAGAAQGMRVPYAARLLAVWRGIDVGS